MARPNVVKLVGVDSKNGEIIAVYISHELSGYKGKFVPERPHGNWEHLKEHITELRDANGYATQYGTCQFILNLMGVIEREGDRNDGVVSL